MCYIFTIVGKYFFLSKSCSLQHKNTHNMCMISCINVAIAIATESPLGPKNQYQICSYNVASHILYFYIYSTVHHLKKINILKKWETATLSQLKCMMEIKLEYWIYFSVHCNSKILFLKTHTHKKILRLINLDCKIIQS